MNKSDYSHIQTHNFLSWMLGFLGKGWMTCLDLSRNQCLEQIWRQLSAWTGKDIARTECFCCGLCGVSCPPSWNAEIVHPCISQSLSLKMTKLFSTTIFCHSQALLEPVWAPWNIFSTCLTLYMGPVTISELFKDTDYSKLSFNSRKALELKINMGLETE